MGQLIRTFLQKRRERKYWRRRLEPVIDRMMEERKSAEGTTGEWIDLEELGNRVDQVTERPTRPGEAEKFMHQAGDEIALDADPVSMAGGSGASMSPDQAPSDATSAAAPEDENREQEEGERDQDLQNPLQTEPFFLIEPVAVDDILDQLIDKQKSRFQAGSGLSTQTIIHGQNALPLSVGEDQKALLLTASEEENALLLPASDEENALLLLATEDENTFQLPAGALEDLHDEEVDALKQEFRRLVRQNAAGRFLEITTTRAPRRKHIDPRATIRRMTRAGGVFNGFSYRPSPSENPNPVDAQHLLVIADVSGSMGRYVGIVLYLLSCLEELATVDSYIFSDATTYASDLLGTGDFHEQFTRLKEGATSWEYGTRLSQALLDVQREGRFHANTRVVLLTDGGFSLIGSDWPDTVRGLLALHEAVESIHLITPNPQLLAEGPACAESLWNVERSPRAGHELLAPETQKTARYGLLTRYSSSTALCQSPDDLVNVLQSLLA